MSDPATWVNRHFRVGFFGEFSSGKSSLINSLVGTAHQEASPLPVTSGIHVLRYPRSLVPGLQTADPEVHDVDCGFTRRGMQLWDSPGSNSERRADEDLSLFATDHVDVAFYLIDATQGVHRSAVEQFRRIEERMSRRRQVAPFLVLNHFDRVGIEDVEEVDELVGEAWRAFQCISVPIRLKATDLSMMDGAHVRKLLKRLCGSHMRAQLVEEFKLHCEHPIRLQIANRPEKTLKLPKALQSPQLLDSILNWRRYCKAAIHRREAAIARLPKMARQLRRKEVHDRWHKRLSALFRPTEPTELQKSAAELEKTLERAWKAARALFE